MKRDEMKLWGRTMRTYIALMIFLGMVSVQAQDSPGLPPGEFTESQLKVAETYENYLNNLSVSGNMISTDSLLDIDLFVTELQFQQLSTALTFEDTLRAELGDDLTVVGRVRLDVEIEDAFPELTIEQRAAIVDAIVAGEPVAGKLAAVVSQAYGIGDFTFEEVLLNAANPTSPTQHAVKDIIENNLVQNVIPKKRVSSSGDWLDNAYASIDYSVSNYEDNSFGFEGDVHYKALVLGGTLFKDTEISMSLSQDSVDQKGSYVLNSETWIFTTSVHHNFDDTWGAGVFGFYSLSDLEDIDNNAYTLGGGLLGSFYHEFDDILELSSVQTISVATTSSTDDTLYMGLYKVSKQLNDCINAGVYTYLSHTIDTTYSEADETYISYGCEFHFDLGEFDPKAMSGMNFLVAYETIEELDGYEQDTYFFSLSYDF